MQQDGQERQRRAERIEALLQEVAGFCDTHARATTEELVQALLDMYGEGLARILEVTAQSAESGRALIEAFAKDELIGALFLLHGLHPLDIETRITRALNDVRPYLKSHGGNVELLRIEDSVAYLRLEGSCRGCSASTATLKQAIEDALYQAVPDLHRLEMEDATEAAVRRVLPVTFVPPRKRKDDARRVEQPGGR